MTVDEFMDAPLSSLRRYLSVFAKLRKWCIDRGLQLHELNPVQLSLWLHSLKTRGPTVAHHYFWSLNWLKEHVGLSLPLDHKRVRAQAVIPSSHQPTPAAPLTLKL
eukprot:10109309-Karenia_brevis.AAC.1